LKQCEVCSLTARIKAGLVWQLELGGVFLSVVQFKPGETGLRTSTAAMLPAILVLILLCAPGLSPFITWSLISNPKPAMLAALKA